MTITMSLAPTTVRACPHGGDLACAEGRPYEPASVLLERIRKEPEEMMLNGKRNRELKK
jgi:hypothetical protein